jgi:hypothetical protein
MAACVAARSIEAPPTLVPTQLPHDYIVAMTTNPYSQRAIEHIGFSVQTSVRYEDFRCHICLSVCVCVYQ